MMKVKQQCYQEIDMYSVTYQKICVEHPGLEQDAICDRMRKELVATDLSLAKMKQNALLNRVGRIGLVKKCQRKALARVEEWARTRFGETEWKAMRLAWIHSVVKLPDGTYRPGDTDDVTLALVEAVARLGHQITMEEMFQLRCMLGWGTTDEILRAGYTPGTRYGAVLQPAATQVLSGWERLDRLEAKVVELEKRFDTLASPAGSERKLSIV